MQRVLTWIVLAVFGIVMAGCTMEQPRPTAQVYPQYRQTANTQARDNADCSAWATDQTGYRPSSTLQGAGIGAAVGALGGAAAGAAIGAATGGGSGAAKGAAIGAAAGGVGGAATGGALKYSRDRNGYNQAYAACMEARGYTVR
jgi:outer membrane lipoprotein SlyB